MTISGGELLAPFPLEVVLTATLGFSGLSSGCQVDEVDATIAVYDYDSGDGTTYATIADSALDEITTCGASWNDLFNTALDLPGGTLSAHLEGLSLNSSDEPPIFE
jgi:hypothetical protein